MAIKERTRTQQWVDSLQRQRVSTILNRVKKLLDFAGVFYPVKIEIRLQALELLPIKNLARKGQSLVFNISPRINIPISNVLHLPFYFLHTTHSGTRGIRPIIRHFLFQPTYYNGRGNPAPTLTFRTHGDIFRWGFPKARALQTSPVTRIYTYQHEAPFEYKRNYISTPVIKTIFPNSGQSGERLIRGSLSSSTAPIILTASHTQVESFVNKKTTHPDRFLTQFHLPQRLDISNISRAAKRLNPLSKKFYGGPGGGFSKEPPGGRRQQTNLSPTLELVTKKIKKIETRINVEKVEKTVVQNLTQQLDQTISQRINKRLAFDSRNTRQLTENIYSRLVNRIVLEKERLEY